MTSSFYPGLVKSVDSVSFLLISSDSLKDKCKQT